MKKYFIETYHVVYEDSYQNGEKEHVNSYQLKDLIQAECAYDALKTFIEAYNLGELPTHPELDILEDHWDNLCLTVMEDEEGNKPSAQQIEDWKEGDMYLYVNHYKVHIYEMKELKIKDIINQIKPMG